MLRLLNWLLVAVVIASAVYLYSVEHAARKDERRIAALKREIVDEREAIKLLRAEWSYLTRPQRLERLARDHLGLEPMMADQVVAPAELAGRLPEKPAVIPHALRNDPIAEMLKELQ